MNKRQYKKRIKKIKDFISNNYDVLDSEGNYKTISVKCHSCTFYESADFSVGLEAVCDPPAIYSEEGNIILAMEEKTEFHRELLGYACPYFRRK